jgi:hydroxymethylpyrimidine/phosphomethylpyrimidine kinase
MRNYKIPTLTIAGSDCSGGAGVQADLKTFSAIGTYGMSVITAITAQNTQGVFEVEELSQSIIKKQIEVVFDDIRPKAVKIGMI